MTPGAIKLEKILPLWRNLQPPEKRAWFDAFVRKYRHAIIDVVDEYLARKAAKAAARPRAGAAATKVLGRRLRSLIMPSVRVGRYYYHSPYVEIGENELTITYGSEKPEAGQLKLYVAARGTKTPEGREEIDVRGAIVGGDDGTEIIHRFDWQVTTTADLIDVKESVFARWFGVPVPPERKLTPAMLEALTALRAEEEAEPDKLHSWAGVHDSTKDALIARGLAQVLDNKHGGFPHYRTTPAGRAYLAPQPAANEPPAPPADDLPPDLWTAAQRTRANLAAMQLVADRQPGRPLDLKEYRIVAAYSGWGGLSIDKARPLFPPGLVPETFGLIHEYYTPSVIAEAIATHVCPLLSGLVGRDGIVRALEPSVGIGRLVRALAAPRCVLPQGDVQAIQWTTIEFSKVSSAMFTALRPDAQHFHMPFERWIRLHGSAATGTIHLILSNPPYGERGEYAREDGDQFYDERAAYLYFMRRAADLLVPGGLAVFLIPAGFLSGASNRGARAKMLVRHHLSAAYRLPSHTTAGREFVPGANVVMDILFWRSRGGELAEVDPEDTFILEGDYFDRFPNHVLGKTEGDFAGGEEDAGHRFRYKVVGDFAGLPPLDERPFCSTCQVGPIAARPVPEFQTVARAEMEFPSDAPEELREALFLGRRVGRYLAAVAADDDRAVQLWPELHAALVAFAERDGNPWRKAPLRERAEKREDPFAQQILNAFDKKGVLVPALAKPPQITPKYGGRPDDVVAQAEALFRQQRSLTLVQLEAFHKKVGGALGQPEILAALTAAEWNINGEKWDHLYPRDAYLTGTDLWDRYDRAMARAGRGDEQARVQARRLLDAIRPAVFEDIQEINPQLGYVPLDLVSGWISDTINARYGRVVLERRDGFVQVRGSDYVDSEEVGGLSPETLAFLGYYNHDPALFQVPPEKRDRNAPPISREERAENKKNLAERRIAQASKWAESFKAWVAADETRRARLTDAYNRSARGRIVPAVPTEPLDIARWGAQAPRLKPHQIAGARRVLAARGGLVAFDVGVGKTYTALAILARARQEGWVRRPVILVPGSLVWKWHDDVLCTLPDYRVAVIGSKRKRIARGERKGIITSETDTPKERADKWIALQSGQIDVVILSFDALGRTRMNETAVLDYINKVESVRRSIALRRRNLEEKAQSQKGRDKLSERERALLEHGTRAWVQEILALPDGYEYDPGVAWDELGVDMLICDEAAAFKNLHKPQAREDGVPKFMGSGGEGSDRAWQLDFRAAQVRKNTGGAGIVLLTATPAKNSPLEFYNLIQFIDPNAFLSAGIHDPEQFIDRFLKIEYTEVLDSTFEVAKRPAVTGFKNLDDLRTIIFTYGEFRTAAEVDLKLPRPVVQTLTIKMDDAQEAKYARYVAEIERILENPSPDGPSNIILGLLARLSLIALHASLEDGYTYATALAGGLVKRKVTLEDGTVVERPTHLPRPVYESPKLTECARRVSASQHCGHIIFCEPTVVHLWMREVLIAHGVPRERIAILNAEETAPADRIRIAREFNGLSAEPPAPGTCARPADSKTAPKYDVVIANSVAYEGVDLQVRTCTIHHIDLPWTPADLEQRNGRAVRQGNTLETVQIYYYFADGSSDGYRFSLIDGKAGWLGDLLKSQVRDTNNPAAQQQLTPEDILLMISRNKEKTKKLLEEKKQRQLAEARARIAREAVRLLRQANGRFAEARRSDDAERAAKLREEGDLRLSDIERLDPEAWPWAKWMYAVRDTELLVPERGAPVFEGLRIARPRAGHEGQFDYLEFGQVITDDGGQKIGIRAPGSPAWELITYTDGTVSGALIRPEHMPREDWPAWPDDDDLRTGAAIEKKVGEVFRYGRFENLRWRGASDVWLEKWWSRFHAQITEGLAESRHREKVPVVDDEGLAIAAGAELRGATILPPTRAGWQRFLELAPTSGENFTALKDIGLAWWGRKVPQDLLSKERNLLRKLIVPRLLEDTAYRNARENSDPQNVRIEHDKALGRVMLDLFMEDNETHGDLYRRYSDDEAFRRSLHEQSFAATYTPEKRTGASGPAKGSATASEPRITDEQWSQLQALFEQDSRKGQAESPEEVDRRVIDNLFLQRAAMGDALAMAGMGKREQAQQAQQAVNTAHRVMILRAEASVLRQRGYGVSLSGAPERSFLLIGLGGQVLAVRLVAPVDKVVVAPGVDAETRAHIERDAEHARQVVEEIVNDENARPGAKDTEEIMLAVWRRARQAGGNQSATTQEPTRAETAGAEARPAAGDKSMTLRIERPVTNTLRAMAIRKAVRSFEEASREYRAAVDASGEGASTFPRGLLVLPGGEEYEVSYNGRVWSGDRLAYDPAKSTQITDTATTSLSEAAAGDERGHAYCVEGRWYGDMSLVRVLEKSFQLSHLGYGDFRAERGADKIDLIRHSDDALLPRQAGRLHTLVHGQGDRRMEDILNEMVRDGLVEIVGSYDTMPARKPPPAPPKPEVGEIRNKDDLTRALEIVGGAPQEWAKRREWDRLRDYDGPHQDIVASIYTWVLRHKRDLNLQSIESMNLAKAQKDAFTQAIWAAYDTMGGVAEMDAIVEQARAARRPQGTTTTPDPGGASASAPAPAAHPERPYEEARAALKALGLPAKKYAYYVKQAETAIAGGKDFRPIVERARKAAGKAQAGSSPAARPAATTPGSQRRRIIDVALETFNAEPRWRLAVLRTRADGHVLVVYPEEKDPEAAVAAIDIVMENIDDVRWVDARIPPADQELIMERLDRALWAAFEAREEEEGVDEGEQKTEIPSPIQGLIDMMERRTRSLGARSQDISREGYPAIARALQDLAVPSGLSAEELQTWLESNHLMQAGEIVGRSRTEPVQVGKLMQQLWDSVLEQFEVLEIADEDGVMLVPEDAIFDAGDQGIILERVEEGESPALRRHPLKNRNRRPEGLVEIWDVKGDLVPGALVHVRNRGSERVVTELYQKLRAFHHNLVHAPKMLQDVRTLLYWTAVMLDAPLCQGEVKQRATAAFEQAKAYYDTARRQVVEGITVDALRRMHEALRRISAAAAEIAKSCGEGQLDIAGAQQDLPVRPEDRAALTLPNAAAAVWVDLARSPDGQRIRATLAGAKAEAWAKMHPRLLGKEWSMGANGPFIEYNHADGIERRIRSEVGDLSVSLINWDGPFIPPPAVERLVATLSRPELAPLREQARRHRVPPASLAVLPLDPHEARGEEPENGYALALHLPDGRGFMFQLDNFAPVRAADLHEPANLWQWGGKDDPDTEAVILARGLDWEAIAALLGLDPADVRPSGRAAPAPTTTTHKTIDTRGLGPRTRALLASAAAKTRRGA